MRSITRITLAALAAAGLAVATVAPAQAYTPKPAPGKACAASIAGMTMTVSGKAYICVKTATGAQQWSPALTLKASSLKVADQWLKVPDKDKMMTGTFGVISNPTSKPVTIIGGTSPYAKMVQVHEMTMKDGAMVMQQKGGGLTVPAKGKAELKVGGNHVMLMGLTKPITAGTMVPITLITADGGTVTYKAMAKTIMGGNETYAPNTEAASMAGMG